MPQTPTSEQTLKTCPVCGQQIPVINYIDSPNTKGGYLGRHSRRGIPATSNCRGSFGSWIEPRRA